MESHSLDLKMNQLSKGVSVVRRQPELAWWLTNGRDDNNKLAYLKLVSRQ